MIAIKTIEDINRIINPHHREFLKDLVKCGLGYPNWNPEEDGYPVLFENDTDLFYDSDLCKMPWDSVKYWNHLNLFSVVICYSDTFTMEYFISDDAIINKRLRDSLINCFPVGNQST